MIRGHRAIVLTALYISAALAGIGCQPADSGHSAAPPVVPAAPSGAGNAVPATKAFPAVADQKNIENGHVVTDKVISGAQPEGEASFKALKALGVKTIVSVDGSTPDVAMANKFGLNYVHIPVTYSGIKPEEGKAIAKALEELPGPIYLHCHHGKHRSAAAVAVACVYNGTLAPEQAESVLKTFGTGENYKGLWQAARDAKPLPAGELKNLKIEFVETKKIGPLAETMVSVDEHWDHLKAIQKAGWQALKNHPDLDPPHEALQLLELFKEVRRTDKSHAATPGFDKLMSDGESGAESLRAALSLTPRNTIGADAALKRIGASCTACHKGFRD